jgi:mannose-6-phosphate isomerase-like protein (cupin superfamily)
MSVIDTSNAENYQWGHGCSGWHLLKRDDFSVIEEFVPPGQIEQRHIHSNSRQFFYILQGEAVLEIDGRVLTLQAQQGIEIPPKVPHQFRNESNSEVRFLVVSVPKAQSDRAEL